MSTNDVEASKATGSAYCFDSHDLLKLTQLNGHALEAISYVPTLVKHNMFFY